MSQQSNQNNWVFSGIGVLLVGILLIVVNIISSWSSAKFDATEQKLHTLTDGTKAIIEELDVALEKYDSDGERAKLAINFYVTYDKRTMPPNLANHGKKVEAMLREIEDYSDNRIDLEVIDPQPYSAEERTARENGVPPVIIDQDTGAQIYLGISISSLEKTVPLSFLSPETARLLEYDIARAISEASVSGKPLLGLMTTYDMSGMPAPRPGMPGTEPWYFRSELDREYKVQNVPLTAGKIDSNLDALLIIHPHGLTEQTEFAIDQYLLGGGKVMALLDAYSVQNRQTAAQRQQQIPGMAPPPAAVSSDLSSLLKAWGVSFESVNVAADREYIPSDPRRQIPGIIRLPSEAINDDHTATKGIQSLELTLAGAFYGSGAGDLEKEVLAETSENVGTLSPHVIFANMTGPSPDMRAIVSNIEDSSNSLALAISLTGDFVSAFQDGPPEDPAGSTEEGADKPAPTTSLKESTKPGQVILIADTDMITDASAPRLYRFQGHVMKSNPPNGNLAFVSNLLDYIAGNPNLLAVRSRGNINRPFTKYQKLLEESTEKQQEELDELLEKRETAQRNYDEARQKHEDGQEISAADMKAINEYDDREVMRETEDRIIELRRELTENVNRIEAKWKWLNIALIPIIVACAAIAHLVVRRSMTSAQ